MILYITEFEVGLTTTETTPTTTTMTVSATTPSTMVSSPFSLTYWNLSGNTTIPDHASTKALDGCPFASLSTEPSTTTTTYTTSQEDTQENATTSDSFTTAVTVSDIMLSTIGKFQDNVTSAETSTTLDVTTTVNTTSPARLTSGDVTITDISHFTENLTFGNVYGNVTTVEILTTKVTASNVTTLNVTTATYENNTVPVNIASGQTMKSTYNLMSTVSTTVASTLPKDITSYGGKTPLLTYTQRKVTSTTPMKTFPKETEGGQHGLYKHVIHVQCMCNICIEHIRKCMYMCISGSEKSYAHIQCILLTYFYLVLAYVCVRACVLVCMRVFVSFLDKK